ncbi:flagellar hook-associated protein FlgK [Gemmata sp. G18]|uniref:Flagellar hook-associated protein 1 n=1 Tax=Gemmata palustris TaxID=2822762 RepID=A0ABS5BSW3_9BACT|nr:flagellar hook-associated protein FlgK [Gemmata palustris]MBP3956822.1 flagellar hook-associated protein FlgK [Gemmata palustris]
MNALSIGTSALQTAQKAMALVGQNIANATTPGYHRQSVNFTNSVTGAQGSGVDIASITRYTAAPVRTAIVSGNANDGYYAAQLATRRQIETTLAGGESGVGDRLDSLFNQVEQLTSQPDSLASRRAIITAAGSVAQQLNSTAGDIDRLRADINKQVTATVTEVNDYATKIADLNNRILTTENRGNPTNDLRDQRDQLIDELSKRVDIKTVEQPSGEINVLASGAAIVVGQYANKFQAANDATGNVVITQQGVAQPVTFKSGTLGALVQDHNTTIPAIRARLDGVAGQLIQRANQVQATGLGSSGPLASTSGTNAVSDPTVPLNTAALPFAVQAGTLTVSVTNSNVIPSTRTNTAIAINPATQSLNDIATALGAVPGLQASVDPTTNTLQIQGQAGFTFDFAGRDSVPAGSGTVANSDTSNLLSALGVNGLFVGSNAAGIAVNPAVSSNPGLLAASRTGLPGDGTNLERLGAIRDQQAFGTRTLTEEFADIAATLGTDINNISDQQTAQSGTLQNLNNQELSVTGVDTNEELLHLLDFQRQIQGASKYLSVVNTALDSLLAILP